MSNTTIPVKFKLGTDISDISKNNNIEQGALYLEQKDNDFNLYFGAYNLKLLPIYQPVRINDDGGVEIGAGAAALNTNGIATSGVAIGKNAKVTTDGGVAVGQDTSSTWGGAVGYKASSTFGGAVGYYASSTGGGGVVGREASSESGGAVGYKASSSNGGSIGYYAFSTQGGAVGYNAFSTQGGAIGYNALAINYKEIVESSLNANSLTLNIELSIKQTNKSSFYFKINNKVYRGQDCVDAISCQNNKNNNGKYEYTIVFKSISTSSSNRNVTIYLIDNDYAGGAVGYNASTKTGGAIGYMASSESGGAVGYNASSTVGGSIGYMASSTQGGAVGYNASSTLGGAVGNGASSASGGAVGYMASSASGGAVGYKASSSNGGAVGCQAYSIFGGAVGCHACSTDGGAIGYNALAINYKEIATSTLASNSFTLNDIKLSTNTTDKSKFYFKINDEVYYGFEHIDTISCTSNNNKYLYTIVFKNIPTSSTNRDVTVYLINDDCAGGAVGQEANTQTGGAVGYNASSTTGFAGGYQAKATADGAVQLGEGTNGVINTLQFRDCQIMDADGYFVTKKFGTNDPTGTATTGAIYYKIIS